MPKGSVQQILVRGPNWLGDAVMCEPALRSLRRLFPQASITLLVKPSVAGLFESHPGIDRIFLYEDKGRHAGLAGKWRLAGDLRRQGFHLAVLFQNAFEAALLTTLAGIRRRYGYATDGRSLLLSDPVATPEHRTPIHQVEYYWNMLKPLGASGQPGQPELFVTPEEEGSMEKRLTQAGITTADVMLGINPGSTYGGAKRWLPDRFAEVAERLTPRGQAAHRRHGRCAHDEQQRGDPHAAALEPERTDGQGEGQVQEARAHQRDVRQAEHAPPPRAVASEPVGPREEQPDGGAHQEARQDRDPGDAEVQPFHAKRLGAGPAGIVAPWRFGGRDEFGALSRAGQRR